MKRAFTIVLYALLASFSPALAADAPREPYGIDLEGFQMYPWKRIVR